MTSRNSFFSFSLLRQKLGQNLWLTALWSVVIFFSLPVYQAFVIQNVMRSSLGPDEITTRINGVFAYSNIWLLIFTMIAATITALVVYHHMNSRVQTDFYNAQPVSRIKRFTNDYISGFAMLAVPMIIGWGITLLMTVLLRHGSYIDFSQALLVLLFYLLSFLIVYAVAIFSCVLCGNSVVGFMGSMVFFSFFPALIGGILYLCDRFYQTFYASEDMAQLAVESSPISGLFGFAMSHTENQIVNIGATWLIGMSIVAAALTAVSFALYRRRKSETAGKAIAFPVAKPIIKYAITFVIAIYAGLLFESIGKGNGWLAFGIVCGLILTTGIINVIFQYDFKSFFRGWKGLLVFSALFALFVWGTSADLTGYDKKLLKADEVKSVGIENYMLNSNFYSSIEIEFTDSENIAAALELAKLGVDSLPYTDDTEAIATPVTSDTSRSTQTVILRFKKKSGGTLTRQYQMPGDEAQPYLLSILNSAEYRQKRLVNYLNAPENRADFEVSLEPSNNNITMPDTKGSIRIVNAGEQDAILAALRKDIEENLSIEYANENVPLFVITLQGIPLNEYNNYNTFDLSYPVYGNYTNTLTLAADYNFDYTWQFDPAYVDKIVIHSYATASISSQTVSEPISTEAEKMGLSGNSLEVTDPEQIREILSCSFTFNAQWVVYPFVNASEDYEVQITFKGTDYPQSYKFLASKIPAFVTQHFAAISIQQ